jgi:hypothetical protein
MGWYHSKNIIEGLVPNARLTEVVEPWFLGNEASKEDKAAFQEFVDANPDVKFLKVLFCFFGVACHPHYMYLICFGILAFTTITFILLSLSLFQKTSTPLKSVDEMEACDGKKKLALIAGRAGSNPQLLREVIDKGVSGVYLEKPGAPSVEKLEEMAAYADAKGVPVYMGYNKNVTKYVVEADAKAGKVHWTYILIHIPTYIDTYILTYIY